MSDKSRFKYLCQLCNKSFWESIERCCPNRLEECKIGCNHGYVHQGMGVAFCIYCDDYVILEDGYGIGC